jgi:helicase
MTLHLSNIKNKLPEPFFAVLEQEGWKELRPCQEKSIHQGLFEGKNLVVCTPTGSGKTMVAELAIIHNILKHKKKAVYIVPLKALANEKFRQFKEKYSNLIKIAMSIGDLDKADPYLAEYDLIITTSEKLDSLLRHHAPWTRSISTIVVDEIHLLNDPRRGPTLEILITLLRRLLKQVQVIGLSATIGNPQELAAWLDAGLVEDSWRPVELKKGVYLDGSIEFKT